MSNLKPGDVFQERYKILAELGSGGMGAVYHAQQIDADRDVALKLLRQEKISDEETVKRFYREFKILSRLQHPHILTIYGLALAEDGIPYAVCEFIIGKTLRQCLQEGAFNWQRCVKIMIQICSAMQFAHEHSVIHRDLKPDNIMLLDTPEPDYVKLIDFGMSRASIMELDESQKITVTGQLLGTANYMSPELGVANPSVDIYALGCILFEVLSAEYLFDADSAIGIIYQHTNTDASSRFPAIKSRIPESLFQIMEKMLAKSPEQRYQSMSAIETELRELLLNPGAELSASQRLKSKPAAIRGRKNALAIAAILLCTFLGAAFMIKNASEQKTEHKTFVDSTNFHTPKKRSIGNKDDLRDAETWLKEALQRNSASAASMANLYLLCRQCHLAMNVPGDPPGAKKIIERLIAEERKHVGPKYSSSTTNTRMLACMYVCCNEAAKAAEIMHATAAPDPNSRAYAGSLAFLFSIEFNLHNKNCSAVFVKLLKDYAEKSSLFTIKAKAAIVEGEWQYSQGNLGKAKEMYFLAQSYEKKAAEAGESWDKSDTLSLVNSLCTIGEYKRAIEIIEKDFSDLCTVPLEVAPPKLMLKAAEAYTKEKQYAKAQRLASYLRDQLLANSPGSVQSDAAEEAILRVLNKKKTSGDTLRSEARSYLQKVYQLSPNRYADSFRFISGYLFTHNRSVLKLASDLQAHIDELAAAGKKGELYESLLRLHKEALLAEAERLRTMGNYKDNSEN